MQWRVRLVFTHFKHHMASCCHITAIYASFLYSWKYNGRTKICTMVYTIWQIHSIHKKETHCFCIPEFYCFISRRCCKYSWSWLKSHVKDGRRMWLWRSNRIKTFHVANERLYKPQYNHKYNVQRCRGTDSKQIELENLSHW